MGRISKKKENSRKNLVVALLAKKNKRCPTVVAGGSAAVDVSAAPLSTFQQRMNLIKENSALFHASEECTIDDFENVVLDKNTLKAMVASCYCVACSTAGTVIFSQKDSDVIVAVKCDICEEELFSSAKKSKTEVNRMPFTSRLVYNTIASGQGYSGYRYTACCLNLPTIYSKRYEQYKHSIGKEIIEKNGANYIGIRECVFKKYAELGISPDADGILDIEVSFDGTLMKRGHTSHIGAAAVIEVHTGFVIDHEVLSNYCYVCSRSAAMSDEEQQKHSSVCHKNFDGKSGSMEKEQAVRLWQRSEALKFRYVTLVSDGVSSSYKEVTALNDGLGPYPNVQVEKQDCINHVAKRQNVAKIWNNLSKAKLVSLPTAQYSISLSVLKHNNGHMHSDVMFSNELTPSRKRTLEQLDKERTRKSVRPSRKKKSFATPDNSDYGAGLS